MNFAHLHLILNHVPVIGIPIALIFLILGYRMKNNMIQQIALLVLVGLALAALPVYLTGEPAEEVIEQLAGFTESFVEPHEDAALFSLIGSLFTGVVALFAFYFRNNEKKSRLLNLVVMTIAILTTLSLFYTANLGGKISHIELRTEVPLNKDTK